MKRLTVDIRQVSLEGGKQYVTLIIGGTRFVLMADSTLTTRELATALYTAKGVTLEVEESSEFPVPSSFTQD